MESASEGVRRRKKGRRMWTTAFYGIPELILGDGAQSRSTDDVRARNIWKPLRFACVGTLSTLSAEAHTREEGACVWLHAIEDRALSSSTGGPHTGDGGLARTQSCDTSSGLSP